MNNRNRKTYYDILEVDVNADASTIRKAYLKKSLKYHPDKNPHNVEEAKAKFIEIGEANETLSDPAKRRAYDQELRSGNTSSFGGSSSSGNNGSSNSSNNENNANDDQTYEDYMNAFDATVAGMSEEELAATIGAVSALAGIVGSIVGSRILGGSAAGGGQNGSGGTRSAARSSILSTAGSMAGGLVASKIASSSVRALHQDSINRLSYKEDCRRAIERGEPVPEPPKPAFMGKKIGDVLKSTINSATKFATAEDTTNQNNNNSGTDTSSNGQREQGATPANKYSNLWKMASAGIKAAQAANQSNKQ